MKDISLQKRLGDFVKIRTGKLDANANDPDGAYPFFTCSVTNLKINSYSYDCECVLVAGNGDLNVKYYDGKFDAYQRTYIIESLDKSRLDVRYLYHFMERYVEKLRTMSIGGVIKYIKLGYLTDAQIPLPPLNEQRRIAAILDKADALREQRRQAANKLDTLLQAVFYEMFGDVSINPYNFNTKALEELIDTNRGISYGIVQRGNHYEGGVPVIRISDFTNNVLRTSKLVCVDPSISSQYRRTVLEGGELIISIRGTVGRVAVVPASAKGSNVSREVAVIPVLPRFSKRYLKALLLSGGAQKFLIEEVRGVAQSGINLADLRRLPVPIPPDNLIREFDERAEKIHTLMSKQNVSQGRIEELFSSLQQRAFNGELFNGKSTTVAVPRKTVTTSQPELFD